MHTIGMVGGRSLEDNQLAIVFAIARRLVRAGYRVVSGGANGADTAAAMGASVRPARLTIYVPPDHRTAFAVANRIVVDPSDPAYRALAAEVYPNGESGLASKAAYIQGLFVRNAAIADNCDGIIAWQGPSGGTAHTMRVAKLLSKPVLDLPLAMCDQKTSDYLGIVRAWLKSVEAARAGV